MSKHKPKIDLCDEVRELNARGTLTWRTRFGGYLEEIARVHPPRIEVDLQALADMVSALLEGGIVLNKLLKEPKLLATQIMLYRSFIQQVFARE